MTVPVEVKIALHYWTIPGDYSPDNLEHRHSSVCEAIYSKFINQELLIYCKNGAATPKYTAGPALQCYIEALCAVPFPVKGWKIP